MNIAQCKICRARLISEEIPNHRCDAGYQIKGNLLYIRARNGKWNKHVIPESVMKRVAAELSPIRDSLRNTPKTGQSRAPYTADTSGVPYVVEAITP